MKIRKVLELSIDVDNVFNDLPHILRALLDTMPDSESKLALLNTIKMDVDHFLKGVVTDGQQVHEPSRIEKDQ